MPNRQRRVSLLYINGIRALRYGQYVLPLHEGLDRLSEGGSTNDVHVSVWIILEQVGVSIFDIETLFLSSKDSNSADAIERFRKENFFQFLR
jgi:hypothetical protein